MWWLYLAMFALGIIVGAWLRMAYVSWRGERLGWLKRDAKRANRHLRRKR